MLNIRIEEWLDNLKPEYISSGIRAFKVVELDDACPYGTEIVRFLSRTILANVGGDWFVFGRILYWVDGECGWLLEIDYETPVNPTSSATWLSYWYSGDFKDFIDFLGMFKAYKAFIDLCGGWGVLRGPLAEIDRQWSIMGFKRCSE